MNRLALLLFLLAPGSWLLAPSARAASCGGATACACGDTVISNYTLTGNLTCGTTTHGLTIGADAVTLDLGGFTISRSSAWTNGATERYGVLIDQVTGTLVKNGTIGAGWRNGIRIAIATGTTLQSMTVTSNGDATAHVGYGVEVTQGSTTTTLTTLTVQSNADEGVHCSSSTGLSVSGGTYTNNFREQLYLLGCAGGSVTNGTYGGTGTTAFYVKDSVNNTFTGATADKQVRVTGASSGNVFTTLTMTGGVRVDVYVPTTGPPRFPSNNTFSGGSLAASSDCLRLDSALTTLVNALTLGACTGGFPVNADASQGPCSVTFANMATPSLNGVSDCEVASAQDWAVHVQNLSAVAQADARVQIVNRFSEPVSTLTSDAGGNVSFAAVVTRRGKTEIAHLTPHWLVVSKDGFSTNAQKINVGPGASTTVSLVKE